MLNRKINEYLIEWKSDSNKLPLVIEGARQVGKTTSIRAFAQKNYKTLYELNFFTHPEQMSIFSGSLESDEILFRLSLTFPEKEYVAGSTLIFLDEIQDCPNARTALKFLARDKRFDVIASGSLLGINYKSVPSFPVGYTRTIKMYPLDFEEFLWAMKIRTEIIESLHKCFINRTAVDPYIHESMLRLFSLYIVIGGMPAAVNQFVKERNYAKVRTIQKNILNDYKKDVIKYAEESEKVKIIRCLESVPAQLAKDYKKFQYSVVEKGSGSSKYGGPLLWLKDSDIVSFCNNLSLLESPLSAYSIEKEFKVYMNDNGLLVSMYENDTAKRLMDGELGLFKGAFYENVIATSLLALGHRLFYFSPSDTLEIDFIINYKGAPCLLEVKSGENTKSKSLNAVLNNPKYKVNQAIRLSRKNVGEDGKILSLPLYMIMFLKDETDNSWESNLPDPEKMFEILKKKIEQE